jgi:hypothetical protein
MGGEFVCSLVHFVLRSHASRTDTASSISEISFLCLVCTYTQVKELQNPEFRIEWPGLQPADSPAAPAAVAGSAGTGGGVCAGADPALIAAFRRCPLLYGLRDAQVRRACGWICSRQRRGCAGQLAFI